MSGCHYPSPPPERERRYQHKVSLVVRYFMIPCNICLILLATSTLGFAVLLFLNNYKPPHFTPAQPPDDMQGRSPTSPEGVASSCLCAGEVRRKKT
ncbi:hypothetical protein LDENG_00109770 [Lucifuga dentata]|nr:hypothetical protein LDENG_00109770 [Lucifuga dentata]